jgi:hypothetical protein
MADPLQIALTGGAAGALLLVLKWIVDGKLHPSSEIDGLRQDKIDLLKINRIQADALKASNEQLAEVARLVQGLYAEIKQLREKPDAG